MTIKYVGVDTTGLFVAEDGNKRIKDLLWGDRAVVEKEGTTRSKVFARAAHTKASRLAASITLGLVGGPNLAKSGRWGPFRMIIWSA